MIIQTLVAEINRIGLDLELKSRLTILNLVKELTDELKESDIAFLTHKIESGHPIEVCKQW